MNDVKGKGLAPPLRVLVVDDEPLVLDFFRRALTRAGHTCATASNAGRLAQHLDAECFDVVIMDYDMPGTSPAARIELVRGSCPDAVVVGHSGRERKGDFSQLGVQMFLMKPWLVPDLLALLMNQ